VKRGEMCYICGQPATTGKGDHVPPKALFPKPRPSNLITVPCCATCNGSYSLDEEYFRNNISMVSDYRHAEQVWKTTKRSLSYSPGLQRDLLTRISPVRIGTHNLARLDFDASRTDRVLVKIARGLVYHHSGHRLLDIISAEAQQTEELPDGIRSITNQLRLRGRCGNTFCYMGGIAAEDPECSLWILVFYVSKVFVVSFGADAETPTQDQT
jgi:hypothetical protein